MCVCRARLELREGGEGAECDRAERGCACVVDGVSGWLTGGFGMKGGSRADVEWESGRVRVLEEVGA
eukprot:713673-Rhodomonas_salina.1